MSRALRVCPIPGCPNLVAGREHYCRQHMREQRRDESRERRAAGTHADYGPEWARISQEYLQNNPLCTWPGCTRRSEVVHHIVERGQGGGDEEHNLRALCRAHHTALHKRRSNDARQIV